MFKSPKLNTINDPSEFHVSGIELVESDSWPAPGAAELRQEVTPNHAPKVSLCSRLGLPRQTLLYYIFQTGTMNPIRLHCSDIYMYVCKNYIYTN